MGEPNDPRQATTLNNPTQQLEILDAVADGVTAQDASGALVYANEAAARAIGFETVDDLLHAPLSEVMSRFELVDENGDPFPVENLPGRLALQGMYSPETVVGFRNVETGEERYSIVKARPVLDDEGRVRLAVNIFQDITERRRAEEERDELLQRAEAARRDAEVSADNLWAIHKVTDVALSNLELDDLLRELLERIREALEVDTAAIFLVTRDRDELRLRAVSGLDEKRFKGRRLPMERGLMGEVASSRRPLASSTVPDPDPLFPLLSESGVVSVAGVPLALESRVIGVLQVGTRLERSFEQREVGLLQLVADRIAFAIDRARAFRAEHRALERSELAVERMGRLLEVTGALSKAATPSEVTRVIIDQGVAAMEARSGVIALVDDEGHSLELADMAGYPGNLVDRWQRMPLDANTPIARAVRERELVLVETADELRDQYGGLEPTRSYHRSFAAIPLITEDRALGALELSFEEEIDFSRVQRAFMLSLGQQCAQALHRARLYEAAQEAHADAELARERIAFLARAGEVLGSSLDYHETLARVARLAVPRVGDWCVIETDEDAGNPLTIAHTNESKVELARELRRRYPPRPDATTGTSNVLRTGEPELYREITEEMLAAEARDPQHFELLRELGLRSVMVVPLKVQGRAFGAITFASSQPHRYGPEDLVFADSLARRAAAAIENARLFRETQESRERFAYLARTLQSSLLPQQIPVVPGMRAAVRYRAAAEGTEVGGDFYDLFPTVEDEWAVVMGDVCGKGAHAAALTGLARHTIRAVATIDPRPAVVLARLNEAIMHEGDDDDRAPRFCTVAHARVCPRDGTAEVTVTSGGHPLPLVLRSNGKVERVGEPGLLLGVFPDAELTEHTVELGAGDAIVFYTDGVTEQRQGGHTFGEKRLRAVVESCVGLDPEEMVDAIEKEALAFSPGGSADDLAVLALRVAP
jgi:PAS domain S-box-containing protein